MRRATITTESTTIAVRGYVRDVLRTAGLKPMWAQRGWILDLWRLPDALAALELAGYVVIITDSAQAGDGR